jgi:molybdopterin converting factor subunit 1
MAVTTLTVRLFASLREAAGWTLQTLTVEESDALTPRKLWSELGLGHDGIPPAVRVAVNQRFAGDRTPLSDGDEVAFLPPISGG